MEDVVKRQWWNGDGTILIHLHLATLLTVQAVFIGGIVLLLFLPINTMNLEFDSN